MEKIEILPTPKDAAFTGEMVRLDSDWGLSDRSELAGIAARYADELPVAGRPKARNVTLQRDRGLAAEEHVIRIANEEVHVTASSERGFLYALTTLRQLRNGPLLPAGTVRDYPRLPIRGIHLMFESVTQMGFREAMGLISTAARLKLNTILMEFGDRFPFERHFVVRAPSSLTREEVKQLLAHAHANSIQPIPLLQSLGHLNYLLKHEQYADIREEGKALAQMCPSNEKSFRVFTELAEEILALFDGCPQMHIGADETRQLGVCPRCKAEADRSGKGRLYVTHINKVCDWLSRRNVVPSSGMTSSARAPM